METEGGPVYPEVESDGEWVKYSDYDQLRRENRELRQELLDEGGSPLLAMSLRHMGYDARDEMTEEELLNLKKE